MLREPQSAMLREPHPVLGLILVCAGAMLGPLDSAVNVAFPAITVAFGLALPDIQWIVIAFVLAQSSLTIVFGRVGDLYGHKRVFAVGMAACAATHLMAGFAPDYASLVVLRIAQGIAVGLAISCGPALATLPFPAPDKRRILGVYVTAISLGIALGPAVGGVLVAHFGWPGVFWFRAPLALLVLLLLPLLADARALPGASAPVQAASRVGFDWPGAAYLAALLACLVLFAAAITRQGAGVLIPGGLLAGGLASTWLFVRHESRTHSPILPIGTLRARGFLGIQLASILVNLACFSIMLLVPYLLAASRSRSIAQAGALLALFPAGSVLGGLAAARLARGVSSVALIGAGQLAAALGLLAIASAVPTPAPATLGAALVLTGFGLGAFQVGYMDATTSMLPPEERGVAGSLVSVTRLLGIVLGASGISWLHQATGEYATTFRVLGAGLLLYAGAFLAARRRRAGR